jgi:hypothetical protein
MRAPAIAAWMLLLVPAIYVSSCSYRSYAEDKAFGAIHVGDSMDDVRTIMGQPDAYEKAGRKSPVPFSSGCHSPCAERLWYLNRMSLIGESWSVDFDTRRRVVDKAFWESP